MAGVFRHLPLEKARPDAGRFIDIKSKLVLSRTGCFRKSSPGIENMRHGRGFA